MIVVERRKPKKIDTPETDRFTEKKHVYCTFCKKVAIKHKIMDERSIDYGRVFYFCKLKPKCKFIKWEDEEQLYYCKSCIKDTLIIGYTRVSHPDIPRTSIELFPNM
jgi:hypothetical protein